VQRQRQRQSLVVEQGCRSYRLGIEKLEFRRRHEKAREEEKLRNVDAEETKETKGTRNLPHLPTLAVWNEDISVVASIRKPLWALPLTVMPFVPGDNRRLAERGREGPSAQRGD
jgi:hypothetical protein